jgi:hypothetical protein
VAAAIGFHKNTVDRFLAKVRAGGKDALKAKPVPGRPAKMSAGQLSRLYTLIVGNDPRQLSFEFALWTAETSATRVRLLPRSELGLHQRMMRASGTARICSTSSDFVTAKEAVAVSIHEFPSTPTRHVRITRQHLDLLTASLVIVSVTSRNSEASRAEDDEQRGEGGHT